MSLMSTGAEEEADTIIAVDPKGTDSNMANREVMGSSSIPSRADINKEVTASKEAATTLQHLRSVLFAFT